MAMWTRIAHLFEQTGSGSGSGPGRPVCFAVFLPTGLTNSTMRTSAFGEGGRLAAFHRRSIVIAPSEHCYLRGNQHEIHDGGESGQVSRTGTTVTLLMNEEGAARWPVTDAADERVRRAFRGP